MKLKREWAFFRPWWVVRDENGQWVRDFPGTEEGRQDALSWISAGAE